MFGVRAFARNSCFVTNLSCVCGHDRTRPSHSFLKFFRCSFSDIKRNLLQSNEEISLSENPSTKILKIAIIGTPNAGKSTFINQIVGRRVVAVSNKVHTTRARARAVININETQVVFLDTPGLVNQTESNKYNLEQAFLRDGELAITECNIVAVIHDASNSFTRGKLDPKVLRLLYLYPTKHTVLIMNKVDTVKKKPYLLELVGRLTCQTVVDPDATKAEDFKRLTEAEVMKEIKTQSGWPRFSQVFMVSALEGSGVGEVMEYMMQYARTGPWMFPDSAAFTDQKPEKVILDTVKAKLLDRLPAEVPYNIHVQMELLHEMNDGTVYGVVLITCPYIRIEKMVIKQIRRIAQEVEAELRSTFLTQVLIKLVVQTVDK